MNTKAKVIAEMYGEYKGLRLNVKGFGSTTIKAFANAKFLYALKIQEHDKFIKS